MLGGSIRAGLASEALFYRRQVCDKASSSMRGHCFEAIHQPILVVNTTNDKETWARLVSQAI